MKKLKMLFNVEVDSYYILDAHYRSTKQLFTQKVLHTISRSKVLIVELLHERGQKVGFNFKEMEKDLFSATLYEVS